MNDIDKLLHGDPGAPKPQGAIHASSIAGPQMLFGYPIVERTDMPSLGGVHVLLPGRLTQAERDEFRRQWKALYEGLSPLWPPEANAVTIGTVSPKCVATITREA